MATKKKNNPAVGIKESANEIWLAGLGAFSFIGQEGSRRFQELVEKGREFEEEHEGGRFARITDRAMELKDDAKSVLNKVTAPIEDGLSATLQRLGMPTRTEIVKLTHRVEELTRIVQQAKTGKTRAAMVETEDEPEAAPRRAKKAKTVAEPTV